MSSQLHWVAVQPTPYNEYFFDELKAFFKDSFSLYYEYKVLEISPFKENLGAEDCFLENNFRLKIKLLFGAFKSRNIFLLSGWNSVFKILIITIRILTKKSYFIWTDSVNSSELNGNPFWSKKIKGLFLNNATTVFTTGKMGLTELNKVHFFSKKTKVSSLPYFTPIPDIQRQPEQSIETIKLLCVSRLVEYKGYDRVIEVVDYLAHNGYDIELKIGGTGPFEKVLKDMVLKKGLESNVQFLGWLSQDEQRDLKQDSHIFVHAPVGHEPYGVVIIENLAFGLPVITSPLAGAGLDRVIDGENGFIIDPKDKEDFAKAIINICKDASIFNQFSLRAKELSESWVAARGVDIIKNNVWELE